MTHWTEATSALNWRSIVGSATDSAVKSFATTNTARPIATRAMIVPRGRRSPACAPAPELIEAGAYISAGDLQVPLRHLAQVHRLLVGLLVDPHLERDVPERPPGPGGLVDDLGPLVVPDVRVERGGGRER